MQRAALARAWDAWVTGTGRQLDLSRADVEFGSLNRTIAALQVARRVISASHSNNIPAVKPMIQLPYVQMDTNIATTAQELENLFNNQGMPAPPQGEFQPAVRRLCRWTSWRRRTRRRPGSSRPATRARRSSPSRRPTASRTTRPGRG